MSTSKLLKLFGPQLSCQNQDGPFEFKTDQVLTPTTIIGLYFVSPTSKGKEMTERLVQFYDKMEIQVKETTETKDSAATATTTNTMTNSFKVIMITFDQVHKNVYIPETKTPFFLLAGDGARIRQEHLIRKYGIQESPTLLLMDGNSGHIINFCAGEKILEDPDGLNFPWRHPSLTQLLEGGQLLISGPDTSLQEELRKTGLDDRTCIRGFLFSAYWCPPCRTFLAALTDAYTRLKEQGKKFEVIFVSSDRSQESFEKFYSKMPWLAIPYGDEERRKSLTAALNVKSIPTLILTDAEDNIITSEGRTELNNDLEGLDFPWRAKLVQELHDKNSGALNHSVCLIYFAQGNDDSEYDNAEAILLPIATQITESDVEEAFEPKFFIATDSELSESLRLFMDLEESKSYLVILDIPNFRYAVAQEDLSKAHDFLQKFQTAKLKYNYIQSRFI